MIGISTSLLLLTACNDTRQEESNTPSRFYYSGIYFGKHFSPTLKEGVKDGCETSKGEYTKNHIRFNTDTDYHTGWFLGRRRCIPLFKPEEENKSIENNMIE